MQNSDDSDQYDAYDSEPKFVVPSGELDADEQQMGVVDEGSGSTTEAKHSHVQSVKKSSKQSWSEEMKDIFKEVGGAQQPKKNKTEKQKKKNREAQRNKAFVPEDHISEDEDKPVIVVNKANADSDELKAGFNAAQRGHETMNRDPKNKLAASTATSWQSPIKATQTTTKKATEESTEPAEGDSADIYDQFDSKNSHSPLNDSNDVRINHIIPFESTMNHFEQAEDLKRLKAV